MLTDYDALKAHGHSPAKAAEIVLDAKRRDDWSVRWIAMFRKIVAPVGGGEGV